MVWPLGRATGKRCRAKWAVTRTMRIVNFCRSDRSDGRGKTMGIFLGIGLLLCSGGSIASAASMNLSPRVANTTLRMPAVPQSRGFALENAFGEFSFNRPVALRTPPKETNQIFVVEQGGRIWAITNLLSPSKTLFLDLSKTVFSPANEVLGLTTMAFHPGYHTNGWFFVGYTLKTQTAGGDGLHYRVSRFSVVAQGANPPVATNEVSLITQYCGPTMALCDDMTFGLDGFLYISVPDANGLPAGDIRTSQRIDADFFGGVLRIDVDRRFDSLMPNPHPAISTNYAIPQDNPFVGATQFNGAEVVSGSQDGVLRDWLVQSPGGCSTTGQRACFLSGILG